jgi:hypothetical protein
MAMITSRAPGPLECQMTLSYAKIAYGVELTKSETCLLFSPPIAHTAFSMLESHLGTYQDKILIASIFSSWPELNVFRWIRKDAPEIVCKVQIEGNRAIILQTLADGYCDPRMSHETVMLITQGVGGKLRYIMSYDGIKAAFCCDRTVVAFFNSDVFRYFSEYSTRAQVGRQLWKNNL